MSAPLHAGIQPQDQRQTPPLGRPLLHSACWDTVNKRAVRIPLECILVSTATPHLPLPNLAISNGQFETLS